MEPRPKITIELTKIDQVLEALSLFILILLWIGTMVGFTRLPEQIPSHFDAAGQADDYSNKASIFALPVLATVLFIGMTIINKYPHIYNYHVTVTAENARRLYTSATKLIRILKLMVVIIFCAILFLAYRSLFNGSSKLGIWFLPAVLALLVVPTAIYMFRKLASEKSYD